MTRQTSLRCISLLAFTLTVLFYSSAVVKAQSPPTGPAGGELSGTYPNPGLAADRVRKVGDTMTGQLNISMPNGAGLIAPFTLSGFGNQGPNRGIAFQFNLPTAAAGSALGAQMVAARESWGAHSYFSFNTHNGTAVSEALRITSSGRVGIGNSAPANQLHISNAAGAATFLVGGSAGGIVNVQDTTAPVDSKLYQWRSEGGVFRMALINDAWSAFVQQNIFVATSAGNIGMGTASPTAKLDVAGMIRSSTGFKFPDGTVQTTAATGGAGSSGWTDGGANVYLLNLSAKVGIGTSTPLQRLQIGSNTATSTATPDAVSLGGTFSSAPGTNPKLRLFDNNAGGVYGLGVSANQFDFMTPSGTRYVWSVNGIEKMRLDDLGNVTASGSIAAKYQDVAEWVPSTQDLVAGTVVVVDHERSNHVVASSQIYDTRVAGVVSAQPGLILGEGGVGRLMVATTGRVRVKVDATRGPIKIGDLLVTGDGQGFAMKSTPIDLSGTPIHRPGTIIGKALEPLEKGIGEILVLLSLQ